MGIAVGMHVVFLLLNALFRKALKLDAVEPVSYTHLDVYKRQAERIAAI